MKNLVSLFFLTGFSLLILLAACRQAPQPPAAPRSELAQLYAVLHEGYGTGDTATALSTVRLMLDFPIPQNESKPAHICTLNRGLLQLMYRYIYADSPGKGFAYFLRLADNESPPLPVPEECTRQIRILTAYLGMQCGELAKAVECLEEGLKLPEPPTPDERYADYTFAAAVYSQNKEMTDRSIGMYEKALVEIKLSKDQSGLPWILGNLGELYGDYGQFEKAVEMYYEALDLFKSRGDTEGIADTYASLSKLYCQWEMPEEGDRYANKGLKHARLLGRGYNLGFSMLQKYEVAEMRQQMDSALYWLQCADSCFVAANCLMDHLSTQGFITRLRLRDPAYLEEGTRRLEEICSDTLIAQTPSQSVMLQLLGECYLLGGRKQEGIRLLESVLEQLEESKKEVTLLDTYQTLITHFRQEKQYEKALAYVDEANKLQEKLFEEEKLHQVTASRIRYETTQKELENKVLQQKVQLKQRTVTFMWVSIILLSILFTGGGLYMYQRHRYLRKISDARLSQISGLLRASRELSEQNSSLAKELHSTSHQLNQVSTELQTVSLQKATADMRIKISTQVFNSDKEAEFRRSFTAIYPEYLSALHQMSPDLTRTDEVIAMLILLDLSSDEVGLTMGISRNGVNKARSRLRQRLKLDSEVKLEEFLKELGEKGFRRK